MPTEILPDEPRAVRHPIREAHVAGREQQMRAPHVSARHDKDLRAVLDLFGRLAASDGDGSFDAAAIVNVEPAHQRARVHRYALLAAQGVPREVRRILRADRADGRAGVVATALRAPS